MTFPELYNLTFVFTKATILEHDNSVKLLISLGMEI